jgi:hypothetical protein
MRRSLLSRRSLVRSMTTGIAGVYLARGQSIPPDRLNIGESHIEVSFSGPTPDLSKSDLLDWVHRSADAVARYYGRFPVPGARLLVGVREGRDGVSGGRTWGEGGARTRISIGQHTTAQQLENDWVMTHEFVHYGFPDVPDRNHWVEEGLATYVEPIARVSVGTMSASRAWFEMLRDMPKGQPQTGDEGLDHTHTWGRTYWGGAMFCLLADVAIRKQTANRKGLRDALRGILATGGSIEVQWPVERAFEAGDRAVGGTPLVSLYHEMGDKASPVDLTALWKQLGVSRAGETAVFDDSASLAAIRRAILS